VTIRVLVVDDSAMVRRVIQQALSGLDGITVVGTASNGQEALTQVQVLAPDLVTLDIEMPVMDGIETMRALRRTHPRLPVIMFSTLTERGARATFDALAAGARDYVTKPTNSSGLAESIATIRHELGTRIRALCTPIVPALTAPAAVRSFPASGTATVAPTSRPSGAVHVLVVGASTGGPDALATVLSALPATLPVPVLVVQHMPPVVTTMLAERLNRTAALNVREAADGEPVRPGTVYIAPGNHHLQVRKHGTSITVALDQGPQENYCRPAVDVLFRSVAAAYGPHTLALVLTGMGSDGAAGAGALVDAGGSVYAQDQGTSVVWGMPGAVVAAGRASKVLPLPSVADAVMARIARPGATP
jgi:two-component system chemotaxis response regulator CheB